MLDRTMRAVLSRPLDAMAAALDRPGVTPDRLTIAGLALALSSAVAAATQWWALAVVLWLLSRVADGLDGTLARRRRARGGGGESHAGGFLDIAADFIAYGTGVFGVAWGVTAGYGAPWWPFLLVLLTYYVNGTAFLAFSSIAERTGRRLDDGRSLSFLGRIAEGTETIIVHAAWLILPFWAWQIALVWSLFVGVSAVQRVVTGYRLLR